MKSARTSTFTVSLAAFTLRHGSIPWCRLVGPGPGGAVGERGGEMFAPRVAYAIAESSRVALAFRIVVSVVRGF